MSRYSKALSGVIVLVLLLGAVGVMDVGVGAVAPVVDNNAVFGTTGNSVKVSNLIGTGFVVSWVTDLVSNGTVRVYSDAAGTVLVGVFVDDGRASTYNAYGGEALVKGVWDDVHVVYVTGLSESTNYWFQVESTTQGGSYPADTVVDDNGGSFYSFNSGRVIFPILPSNDDYVVVTSNGVTPVGNVLVLCYVTHAGMVSCLYHQWTLADGIADFIDTNFRTLTRTLPPSVGDAVHVEAWGGALGNASWDGTWNGQGNGGLGSPLAILTLTPDVSFSQVNHSQMSGELWNGVVSGNVTDKDDNPVEGAVVTVYETGTIEINTVTTGPDGNYSMDIEEGIYSMTASKSGYKSQTKDVTITAGGIEPVDFMLEKQPSKSGFIPTVDVLWVSLALLAVCLLFRRKKSKKPSLFQP